MGREPLVVEGPGERREPLDELGWLQPGAMVGLELLRLNRRMAGRSSQQAVDRRGRAMAEGRRAECRAGSAPAEGDLEGRHGLSRARQSDPQQFRRTSARISWCWCRWCGGPLSCLGVVGCRAAAGGTVERRHKEAGTDCRLCKESCSLAWQMPWGMDLLQRTVTGSAHTNGNRRALRPGREHAAQRASQLLAWARR